MIDRFLMRFWVQLASGSESICQIWLQLYWVTGGDKKKEGSKWQYEKKRVRKRSNRKHCRVRTGGGLGKMLKWRCDHCFRTLRLLHSLSEPPPFVLALFSLPLLSFRWSFSTMISAVLALKCQTHNILYMKGRKCQYGRSLAAKRKKPFSGKSNWQDRGQDSTYMLLKKI